MAAIDVQENAQRNLSIAVGRLEEMRWAVQAAHGTNVDCLTSFDEGIAKLKESLSAIQASPPKIVHF
ncbi:MAG: hypothetical protein FD131_3185 [Rhodocyclaceae bacterium]|nr:MAG: hypothetical protein FD131_3185 [Rhodocyclaceae bacterium]